MGDRTWRKGDNGLWSSFDPVIRRQQLAQKFRERPEGIAERFEEVMRRNGWERLRARSPPVVSPLMDAEGGL